MPAAVISAVAPVSRLLNTLGPSHTAQAIRSNKAKFDDLGQQAVTDPNARATGLTNSGQRVATSKTALAWLNQIVDGPGFQGGAGTPFPDNPRDFLVWGPRSSQTDPNRINELDYATQVRDGVNSTLAANAAVTVAPLAPVTPPIAFLPSPLQPRPTTTPPAAPVTDASGNVMRPTATADGAPIFSTLFQRRPDFLVKPTTPATPSSDSTLSQILDAVKGLTQPAPAAQPNITVTVPSAATPAPTDGQPPAPKEAGLFGGLPTPLVLLGAGALAFLALKGGSHARPNPHRRRRRSSRRRSRRR